MASMAIEDLAHYGLAADRGFLSQREIDEVALPADFAEVEAAGLLLPDLLTTGRVRHWLDRLPTPDIERFLAHAGEPELIAAMVRYSFLTQRSEEHTSELQSLMRISYAVFSLNTKTHIYSIYILFILL